MAKKYFTDESLSTLVSETKTYTDKSVSNVSTVEVSETEPTNESVDLWVNPTNEETVNIPEINDTTISTVDTWSSNKINSEISQLKESKADQSYVDSEIAELKQQGVQQVPLFADSVEECTDTSKLYVLPDGFIYAYMTVTEESSGASYTNVLPQAIDSDGTPYNGGLGYKTGYRVNSSFIEKEATGRCCTGFIPVTQNDVIRLKNIYHPTDANYNGYIQFFDSDFGGIGSGYEKTAFVLTDGECTIDVATCQLSTGVSARQYFKYFRISTGQIDSNSIITINQEIKEGTTTTTTQKWANTGHAFVPNENYDEIVAELQRVTTSHTQELENLREQIENETAETVDSLELIRNWDAPIYDAHIPVFELSAEKTAMTNATCTPDALYALYDALMAKHPEYISKTDLGLCSDGVNHVYRYDFKEPEPHHQSGYEWSETKTKAILVSGIHYEWAGMFGLYYALEEIADNPELFDLRRNTHFIVVPCMNPYCTIASNYDVSIGVLNANGVQIHRNFEVGFIYPDESGYVEAGNRNHGGTEPLSEVETQYVDNIMKNNTDSAFFLTCHNYGETSTWGIEFIWPSTATAYMCNMGYRLIDKMSKAWMNKWGSELEAGIESYRTDELAEWDYRFGMAHISSTDGTETRQATKYGIQGANVEINNRFFAHGTTDNPEPAMSSFTMSRGCETYVNFLLMACGLYDYKDKKEYFKS